MESDYTTWFSLPCCGLLTGMVQGSNVQLLQAEIERAAGLMEDSLHDNNVTVKVGVLALAFLLSRELSEMLREV